MDNKGDDDSVALSRKLLCISYQGIHFRGNLDLGKIGLSGFSNTFFIV